MSAFGGKADVIGRAPCVRSLGISRLVTHAMEVSRRDQQGTRQDALRGERPGAGWSHDRSGVTLACTEKGSIANRALPFFFSLLLFSLVLVLQLPQQSPRDNHGQDETHEHAKGDINRDHRN